MSLEAFLTAAITITGWGHVILIVGSLAIPHILQWGEQTAALRPLLRQVFWTYSVYIWATNLWFGLISLCATQMLVERNALGAWVTGFITLYWGARIGIQIFYYDRSDAPQGAHTRFGEIGLFILFIGFTGVYGTALLHQLGAIG